MPLVPGSLFPALDPMKLDHKLFYQGTLLFFNSCVLPVSVAFAGGKPKSCRLYSTHQPGCCSHLILSVHQLRPDLRLGSLVRLFHLAQKIEFSSDTTWVFGVTTNLDEISGNHCEAACAILDNPKAARFKVTTAAKQRRNKGKRKKRGRKKEGTKKKGQYQPEDSS